MSAGHLVRALPDTFELFACSVRLGRLRGKLCIKTLRILLISGLFRGQRRTIQPSEPAGINFELSLKFLPRLLCSAEFQKQTSELFTNRHERSRRNRMFSKNVFGIGRTMQRFKRFVFLAFG